MDEAQPDPQGAGFKQPGLDFLNLDARWNGQTDPEKCNHPRGAVICFHISEEYSCLLCGGKWQL